MSTTLSKANLTAYGLNQLINVFWSVISFGPVSYFCYVYMYNRWFYIFLAISVTGMLIPEKWLDKFTISKSPAFYRKAGVRFAQKFTQDGVLINQFIRRKTPDYEAIRNKKSIEKLKRKGFVNEKFHLMMFIFFLLAGIYALVCQYWLWGLIITLTNIIFNVYPVLLQHYNRLRMMRVMGRYR